MLKGKKIIQCYIYKFNELETVGANASTTNITSQIVE